MAQFGSASGIAENALIVSGKKKECSMARARSNCFCASGEHEVLNSTRPSFSWPPLREAGVVLSAQLDTTRNSETTAATTVTESFMAASLCCVIECPRHGFASIDLSFRRQRVKQKYALTASSSTAVPEIPQPRCPAIPAESGDLPSNSVSIGRGLNTRESDHLSPGGSACHPSVAEHGRPCLAHDGRPGVAQLARPRWLTIGRPLT